MKYLSAISVLILGLTATLTLNSTAQQNNQTSDAVVAKIAGTSLTAADFEKKQSGDLLQARYQMYLSERKILDQFIDNQLLELQAKKAGLTVDQLLEKEAYKGIKDPTEDQLEVYYEGLGVDQPFAAVHDQILSHIRDLRRTKARTAYVDTLRTKSNIRILLAPPSAAVDAQGANMQGSKDAPVTLVEFADYQCPYCAKVNPLVQQLEKEYGNKLAVVYKDFPLPMHKDSEKAAEGARCAGEQGKFWEYHDVLFSTHQVDVASLKMHAGELKLDQAKFDACLDSGAEAAAVKKDLEEGRKLGLTATPSFFVNGHFFSGAADANTMHEILGMEMPAGASAAVPPTAIAQASSSGK
jgi:predicted DsbA family dithiol-disulfide isomerase